MLYSTALSLFIQVMFSKALSVFFSDEGVEVCLTLYVPGRQ